MQSSSQSSTPVWAQKSLYLLAAVFLALYYFLFLSGQLKSITIELRLSAAKPGLMTFYLPNSENAYSQSKSRSIRYPAGSSSHQLDISYFPVHLNLRFDPDNKQNDFQLQSLSFTRAGNTTRLNARQIVPYIVGTIGMDWALVSDRLAMTLKTDDPQLILGGLPIPSANSVLWFSPIPVLFLLIYIVRRASSVHVQWVGRLTSFAIVILAVLYWSGGFFPRDNLYKALVVAGLAALVIVLSIIILEKNWQSENRFGFVGSILIISLFITVLMGQMFLSLQPESLLHIKKNVRKAFAENRDSGLNSALKMSRESLEKTFVRNFYFRQKLLTLNAESKIFTLGFSPTTKVIIGKDNWFFEGYGGRRVENDIVGSFDNVTDYMGQNPFTESDLEAWRIALEERYYWLKERGSSYIFALAPTKALVYPEKLPERILKMKQKLSRPTRYDQLIIYLREKSIVPVVDLREALLAAKEDNPAIPLYYRTDFHWNYYGALCAYQAIIDGINTAYPRYDLKAGQVEEFVRKEKTNWVHARFMGMVGLDPLRHQNDTYFSFFPKPESQYSLIYNFGKNGISDHSLPNIEAKRFGRSKFGVREIDNPNGKMELMFIVGDSFIEKTLGYFSLHSKKVLNFRVVTNFPTAPFTVMGMKPEIVVQEVLNMYLLQAPPGNPPQVREARVRALNK